MGQVYLYRIMLCWHMAFLRMDTVCGMMTVVRIQF